ncbi:paraquat-inducible protein A [Undibacterium sp.]|jgi:paraquat-inducible protein A|uniref:paraquat-inducible protein A n=1 Tax=Undibacterium sp. TaxID=1914977 RepID=UPI002D09B7AA|nr:paraquat-inducible protein A [Undibacterium sp.]HTD02257.1 paraquat-inducible protein A [Undibacterium sp.]
MSEHDVMSGSGLIGKNGAAAGLVTCDICKTLCSTKGETARHCPCCSAALHLHEQGSLAKSAAYLIAAAILYVPANLLPVMHTETIFGAQDDTIMSGVVVLLESGSWPLALLVFFASIMVPLLKLFSITLLLLTCWKKSRSNPLPRTQLFRIVEAVGRWSMLDVYVVTVLVALVQFQSLASVSPGGGALAFASVVVLTMLSAQSFDSRLIWAAIESSHE